MDKAIPEQLLGIVFGLASAVVWGGSGFAGGMVSRRIRLFQVLILTTMSGTAGLLVLAFMRAESLPSISDSAWAAAAGFTGAFGTLALYRGISLGQSAIVAPTAALVGALLPVLFGILTIGLPGRSQTLGFLLGLVGIWLVSRSTTIKKTEIARGYGLGAAAGLGYGGFYILIAQVEHGEIISPLVITKAMALLLAATYILTRRIQMPSPLRHPLAVFAGLMDAGGGIFYLLAGEFTRLDIAAVLSSMYPAATVLLSSYFLKEAVTRAQWIGIFCCLGAVSLIVA
jgi:drug/metabolite transporter (DMT)-like permease